MRESIRSWGIMALGAVIFALAFDCFFVANDVAMAGVTGLAQILNALFPALPVGTTAMLLNVPLFIAGWRLIGFRLLASSLFSMAASSIAVDVIARLYTFPPMDPMLAAVCGGAVTGLGLGLVFSQGATTGGTDMVARLLKLKFPWLPMGRLILAPDGIVLALTALAFGRIETPLYGVVALYVSTKVMDMVLYGPDRSRVAYIISRCPRETAAAILARERGVTVLQARGAYTGQEREVLMVAFPHREIVEIKRLVHAADPAAFMIVCEAREVLGEGFGTYQGEDI